MITPYLQWKDFDGRDQVFPLSKAEIVIGRKSDADVIVPASQHHVSRLHAKIVATDHGHHLSDLGSTYGTFVNDQRIDTHILRHGDRIAFGANDLEYQYLTREAVHFNSADTSQVIQRSLNDLNRVLPSPASDLENILCVLDFQYQWNQVFTPETGLEQILEAALKISGAERAFIMVRKGDEFGYAAGLDGRGRRLSESHFRTSQSVVRQAVATGKPVSMVEGIEGDFAAQASIVAMNLRAVASMPLYGIPTGGDSPQILGILYLDSTKAMHSLSGLDQRIINKLALDAGNVLERVEMIKSIELRKNLERDLALAEETQRSLLPHELPQMDGFVLRAYCGPTRYVGGDFYDFHVREQGELIGVLADVSGKGVAASLLSSMLLGCLQLLLRAGHALPQAVGRLNGFLHEKASGRFATMFLFSILPDGKGQFVSAGHNPAYWYRASKNEIEELQSNGLPVGAFDFAAFQAGDFSLDVGDVLVVYSDGLTEAENASREMFGEDRLKEVILEHAPHGAVQLDEAMLAAIRGFTRGHTQTDDITIVILQRV